MHYLCSQNRQHEKIDFNGTHLSLDRKLREGGTGDLSLGLSAVNTDSVKKFAVKVDDYASEYPDCKGNALYGKIQANIKIASLRITVEADTAWAGTTYIEF